MIEKIFPHKLAGSILIPPSKSDSQRALLAAALCEGESILINRGSSKDELAMLQTIQALGCSILEAQKNTVIQSKKTARATQYHVGESGLGIRLLTPTLATFGGEYTITGSGSLAKRPLDFFAENLPKLGVAITCTDRYIPLQISGQLRGGAITVDGSASSQYISGLLMALPLAEENSLLRVENLSSRDYVAMTIATLKHFGIEIHELGNDVFEIPGKQAYVPCTYHIESDWSSASYWIVAAALGSDILIQGLREESLQADKSILAALHAAGCTYRFTENGLRVDGWNRKAFDFDASSCPDLFPALCTLAALTPGSSTIRGTHRLIHKESNRTVALLSEFRRLGVNISEENDCLHIFGSKDLIPNTLSAHNDHRIAMCLAIAGLYARGPVEIHGAESVGKSYPEFWDHLRSLRNTSDK